MHFAGSVPTHMTTTSSFRQSAVSCNFQNAHQNVLGTKPDLTHVICESMSKPQAGMRLRTSPSGQKDLSCSRYVTQLANVQSTKSEAAVTVRKKSVSCFTPICVNTVNVCI